MPETTPQQFEDALAAARGTPTLRPRQSEAVTQLDAAAGRGEWYDDRIPLEQRVSDAARTYSQVGVRQNLPFEQVARQVQDQFQGRQLNLDPLRRFYEQDLGLHRARQAYESADPDAADLLRRHALPFAATYRRVEDTQNYADALRRFQAGQSTPRDHEQIAQYERRQAVERNYSPVQQVALSLLDVPAMVGEAYLGGRLLGAAGSGLSRLSPAAAGVASRVGSNYPALAQAGRVAANEAVMPSMYAPQAAEHALEHGGNWRDLKNLAPAYAVGYLNTAILGNVMSPAGGGVRGYLGRVAAGVGEQQLADLAAHGLGLQTQYGSIEHVLNGNVEDGLFHVGTQALTFALFGALHAGTPGRTVLGEARDAVDAFARRGLGRDAAGRAVLAATQPLLNDLRENGTVTRNPVIDPSAPEPLRRYVETVAELMRHGATSAELMERRRALAEPEPARGPAPGVEPQAQSGGNASPRQRTESPITPEQAAAALAREEAKGPSRNRVEPRTPPPEQPAPVAPTPFDHLDPATLAQVSEQLAGKKAKTAAELVAALKLKGHKPETIQAMSDATRQEGTPKGPQVVRPLERPQEAAEPQPAPPPPEQPQTPPAQSSQPQPRPENAWNHTGTEFRNLEGGGPVEFTGRDGKRYTVHDEYIRPGERESSPHGGAIIAVRDAAGNEVGHVGFFRNAEGHWQAEGLHVDKSVRDGKERRTGVAAAMYDFIAAQGEHVVPAGGQTPEGKRFWQRNRDMAERLGLAFPPDRAKAETAWESIKARHDRGERVPLKEVFDAASLTPREAHVITERLQGRVHEGIGSDPVLRKDDGTPLSRQRVKQIEQEAMRKLGLDSSIDFEVLAPERLDHAIGMIERGQKVTAAELHADPEATRTKAEARQEQIAKAEDAADRLTDQWIRESEAGTLSPERQAHYDAEFSRIREAIQGRPARQEAAAKRPLRKPAGADESAPVRPQDLGGLPEGAPLPGAAAEAPGAAAAGDHAEGAGPAELRRPGPEAVQPAAENPPAQRRPPAGNELANQHAPEEVADVIKQVEVAGLPAQAAQTFVDRVARQVADEAAGPQAAQGASAPAGGQRPGGQPPADAGPVGAGQPVVGRGTRVVVAGGQPLPARYEVRELDTVRASDQVLEGGAFRSRVKAGEYPAELQPRDYSVPGEREKVYKGGGQMIPDYFVSNHPDATNGPPTITADGTVLNGNGRQMMLEYARHQDTFAEYRKALTEQAAAFGLDPARIAAMRFPALYRVVDLDPRSPQARDFAAAGNVSSTQAQSPLRTAASLGRLVSPEVVNSLRLEGDTTFSEAVNDPNKGRAFRDRLYAELPRSERERYFQENGLLTEGGKELVRDLLLSRLLPVETIEKLGEEARGLKRTLEGAIPQLLELQRDVPQADVSPQLAEAVGVLSRNPDIKTAADADRVLSMGSLFGGMAEPLSPGGRMLLDFVRQDGNKSAVFRKKLSALIEELTGSGGLFASEAPDPATAAATALGVPRREGAAFGSQAQSGDNASSRQGRPGFPEAPSEAERRAGSVAGGQPGAGERQRPVQETALANEQVDRERAARDMPQLMSEARRSNAAVWDAAMAVLDRDPQAGERLVDELAKNPRATTVQENALLLQRRIALGNEHSRSVLEQIAEFRRPKTQRDEAKLDALDARERALNGQIDQLDRVTRQTGTEWGRAGQFRRQLAAEDYSLTRMLNQSERAKGAPLTAEEKGQIADLQQKIKELQTQLAGLEDSGQVKPGAPSEVGFRLAQAKAKFDSRVEAWRQASAPWHVKALQLAAEAVSLPRALMASIDFPLLRQGLIASVTHPLRTAKAVPEMFRSFFSEEVAQRARYEIDHRPNAPLYDAAGLDLTNRQGPLNQHEEGFLSRLVNKIPVVGHVTRASERSYQTVLNRIRADSFDAMAGSLSQGGKLTTSDAKVIANYVNVMTGRGSLGQFQQASSLLSHVFFAPKWAVSRFQMLLGQPLYSHFSESAPRARALVAKEYARLAGGFALMAGLASLAGFQREDDPRSSDFGKLKVGNTRLDLTGGLAGAARLLSQTMTLSTKNQRGRVMPLSGQLPYGKGNYADVLGRFLRGKLAPAPGAALNLLTGTDVVGQPVTAGGTAANMVTPLFARDVYEAMLDLGYAKGTAVSLLGLLGLSMTTYDANAPRPAPTPQQ